MPADRGRASGSPTISEVAAEAGVGRATAARTLGGYGYVSPELKERVLAAAEKLGYRANALARSMSTGDSHTLGVIVADIGNPFFAGVVRGICDTSRARGFDTIVLSTYENLAEEVAATNVLIDKRVDGVIIASPPSAAVKTPTSGRRWTGASRSCSSTGRSPRSISTPSSSTTGRRRARRSRC